MCLWPFNIHNANSIFSGATLRDYICLLVQITNRWYVCNHFISNVLKKTKLFSFNTSTVTFFLAVSNLLPRGSREPQLPPSPPKMLNYHISRIRQTRIPLFAPNWDIVSPILYTKNHVISYTGTLARICASLIRPRPRGEEGNCSYLLLLSHCAHDAISEGSFTYSLFAITRLCPNFSTGLTWN